MKDTVLYVYPEPDYNKRNDMYFVDYAIRQAGEIKVMEQRFESEAIAKEFITTITPE